MQQRESRLLHTDGIYFIYKSKIRQASSSRRNPETIPKGEKREKREILIFQTFFHLSEAAIPSY